MSLFPVTQFDFPNVSNYDMDLREVLDMYGKLISAYESIVGQYDDLTEKYNKLLSDYETAFALYRDLMNTVSTLTETTNERFATVETQMDSLVTALTATQESLEQFNAALQGDIDTLRASTELAITNLSVTLNTKIDSAVDDLQNQIDSIQSSYPDVYNPARNMLTAIQTVIDDFWRLLRAEAYTAGEFDSAEKTAGWLDGLGHTAQEWDVYGKVYLAG